jgi:RND family efflux transporter MFP subunit
VNAVPVEQGTLAPTAEFKGVVYYKEVSELATEVSGKVVGVHFEEGEHVKKGATMVELDSSLLEAELAAARALYTQSTTQVKQERTRLKRQELLLQDEATTPQQYDDIRFTVESYEHRAEATRAEVLRLERELEKKSTRAPFDGVVIERKTELGEWKSSGDSLAVIARDGLFDIIVSLPERCIPFVNEGAKVSVRVNALSVEGTIVTIVPRGDVATGTFPVKIRVEREEGLLEAMSAQVDMPIGNVVDCLLVPRDALLLERGQNSIVVVQDGAAQHVPVKVLGYKGLTVGIAAEGLTAGLQAITKGHERVRDGQPVEVLP